ncbi:hypothetical protein LTR85_006733 [Meristemomyces frigidus]|nr:hypothetical protein LTR85_006733 [Meristemomyces frigidus]
MASGKDLEWIRRGKRPEYSETDDVMSDFKALMWEIGESELRHWRDPYEKDEKLFTTLEYAYGSVDLTTFERTDPSGREGVWEPIGKCFLLKDAGVTWPSEGSIVADAYHSPDPRIAEFFPMLSPKTIVEPCLASCPAEGKHEVILLPAPTSSAVDETTEEYVLRVLPGKLLDCNCVYDPFAGGCGHHAYYQRLNGTQLEFRSSFRPANQYVFYHYLISLMKKVRHWQSDWQANGEQDAFVVRPEDRWPAEADGLIKRSALESIIIRFGIDYEMIADIIEPHVIPGSLLSSTEDSVAEDLFAMKLTGWDEYDRVCRH